jgi:hypothetical protein
MQPTTIQLAATLLFALAVCHTFLVKKFEHWAHQYPQGSIAENILHFLAEVEAVFGLWAAVLLLIISFVSGFESAIAYIESINFTEPVFVFVIMCMAGTRPIIKLAETIIITLSKLIPIAPKMSFYITALIVGPILGSFITEPAAMTVTALILLKNFYSHKVSEKFKYATLGLLFVNVSIGGTLSHFAAPPVLMVAQKWGLGFSSMLSEYGYKAFLAILLSTVLTALFFRKELQGNFSLSKETEKKMKPKWWIYAIHILFMALVVYTAHHLVFFMGVFLFFMGFTQVTQEYQDTLKLKESLMVGFFLAGLMVLGKDQAWWIGPFITSLGTMPLYIGATLLTAITDNAALTYLGSLGDLSEASKYFLLAGAVTGGGLTVIANAPNPAGFGILKDSFGEEGISPFGLLKAGLIPTIIAFLAFLVLPHF